MVLTAHAVPSLTTPGWCVWPTECGRNGDYNRSQQLLSWAVSPSTCHTLQGGQRPCREPRSSLGGAALQIWPVVSRHRGLFTTTSVSLKAGASWLEPSVRRQLDRNAMRGLGPERASSAAPGFLTHRSRETTNVKGFNVLSSGVICYTALEN